MWKLFLLIFLVRKNCAGPVCCKEKNTEEGPRSPENDNIDPISNLNPGNLCLQPGTNVGGKIHVQL